MAENRTVTKSSSKVESAKKEAVKQTAVSAPKKTSSNNTKEKKSKVTVVKDPYDENVFTKIKTEAKNLVKGIEKGFVNAKTKSSITMRKDGDVSLVSNDKSQIKLDSSGKSLDMTQESIVIANRRTLEVEEIMVNQHKMNMDLLNFTDGTTIGDNNNSFVSNLLMSSSVVVKAWDRSQGKYMLIRRPAHMPIFGVRTNVAVIPEDLKVDDKIEKQINELTSQGQSVAEVEEIKEDSKSSSKKQAKKVEKISSSYLTFNGSPILKQ